MDKYIIIIIDKISGILDGKHHDWLIFSGYKTPLELYKYIGEVPLNVEAIYGFQHKMNNIKEWILDEKVQIIKDEFINSLHSDIKDSPNKILIAGHWGDGNNIGDYKAFIDKYNQKLMTWNEKKYFLSYFGSLLGKEYPKISPDLIRQILELSGLTTDQQIDQIFGYYSTQKEALSEYLKINQDESLNESIKKFLSEVDNLEILYNEISQKINL